MTLEELREQIQDGWKVRVIDHDHSSESREDCTVTEVSETGFVIVPKKPWTSQGRKFTFMHFLWESTTTDRVVNGLRVDSYVTGTSITSRSMPGVPRLLKSYIFEPPRGY